MAGPAYHGRTHLPGGTDPIPGLQIGSGSTRYAALVAALTPAGYWKLPETGTDDWADSSGQGRTLTYVAQTGTVRGVAGVVEEDDGVLAVTVAGGAGSSTHADTSVGSRRGDSGLIFGNVTPITVVAWVNADSLPAGAWSDGICGNVDNDEPGGLATQGYGLYIDAATGFPLFRRRDNTGTQADAIGTSQVPLGTWTMLAGVFTGSAVELYVDGALVDTTAASGNLSTSGGDCFFIGACGIAEGVGGTWAPFRGDIDSVFVAAADLGDQISALFDAGPEINEPAGEVWTADGAGGTSWEPPTVEVDYGPVDRFSRLTLGSNLSGTDLGGGEIELDATGGGGGGVDSLAKSGDTQLTGDVTLSEGAGVTLTQVGQDIEIASAGGGPFVDSLAKSGDTQLTGDVTLSEGANIVLTQVGQDIEIEAAISGGTVDVQDFTASGTWTKPAGFSMVEVICIGGGGQGGGGASSVSTNKSGGGGGGGGAVTRAMFRAADLAATVAVTVGAGGSAAGGGGAAGAGAGGTAGSDGGLSSFGTHLKAGGGGGGVGGGTSNPAGGGGGGAVTSAVAAAAGTPASTGNGIGGQGTPGTAGVGGFYADWGGGAGGGGAANAPGRGGGSTMYGCPGGGAGGGVSAANAGLAGGAGGTSPSITAGTTGGGGTAGAPPGTAAPGAYTGPYSGTGGEGGGGGNAGNAGATGGAGFRGSGGGGGGAGSNSSGSSNAGGTGGAGGGGRVIVISY